MKMTLIKKIWSMAIPITTGLCLSVLLLTQVEAEAPTNDEFIRGYATSIFQRDIQIGTESLDVNHGVVSVRGLKETDVTIEKIITALSSIQGVKQVIIVKEGICL